MLQHIITLLHIQAFVYLNKETNKLSSYPCSGPLSSKCLSECEANIAGSSNLLGVAFWPTRRPMWAKRGWGNPRFGFCRGMHFFFLFLSNSCRLLYSSRLWNSSTRLSSVLISYHVLHLGAHFQSSKLSSEAPSVGSGPKLTHLIQEVKSSDRREPLFVPDRCHMCLRSFASLTSSSARRRGRRRGRVYKNDLECGEAFQGWTTCEVNCPGVFCRIPLAIKETLFTSLLYKTEL